MNVSAVGGLKAAVAAHAADGNEAAGTQGRTLEESVLEFVLTDFKQRVFGLHPDSTLEDALKEISKW